MKNFVKELEWRGLIHDIMPGAEEELMKGVSSGYIGFDPTADSLHIGNLVPIMLLVHFQRCGHKPIALLGGATGMIGDPSGKSAERNLLSEDVLLKNLAGQKVQLEKFLNFDCGDNSAELVNNYDWFKNINILDFLREAGKHLTVNYMMSKESVKKRIETGISFTEFSYQLIQGYDFYHLYKEKNCIIQLGGSDQWGNITSGTELIRRMGGGEGWAITTPLLTKADGSKFGKSEGGNVWLDPKRTSPYKFYQYWINTDDADAKRFIRIFTLMSQEEIEALEKEHDEAPHLRTLQKTLAEDITVRVHSREAYDKAIEASAILFGKNTADQLVNIDEDTLLAVFEGVPQYELTMDALNGSIPIVDLLADKTDIASSNGDARRSLKGNAISINKIKVQDEFIIQKEILIKDKYLIVQKGKKNYYLIRFV